MKRLLDVRSAAQLLSLSHWCVRDYIRQGKLRPVRIGRRVLLEEGELERFIAANRKSGDQVAEQSHTTENNAPKGGNDARQRNGTH